MKEYYLHPGEIFYTAEEMILSTLLGSCVGVCLYDPTLPAGGLNHYLLPLWNGEGLETPRYGNVAIEKLIDGMLSLGSRRKNLKAKVFGGGNVLNYKTNQANIFQIGERNIEIAHKILKENGISIIAESSGDNYGRKIAFNTHNGKVILKRVKHNGEKQYGE